MRAGRQGGVVVSPTAGMKPPPLEQTDPVGAELKRLLDERAAEETKPLALGIHFGLDAERYHRDDGIGSGGIRQLARNPADYWYYSWMNPNRPADHSTPGQERGSAMHMLIFDGETKFSRTYCRGPDQEGMTTAEKTASTKAANADAAKAGMKVLKAPDYDRVVIAAHMITLNPALASAFQNGMSEVSVIYERDGIRRKARFDYIKTRGVGDLKACANTKGINFAQACRNDITNFAYHEQASWYLDARLELHRMIAEGAVYGDHDPAWLKRIALSTEWGWQWIFIQSEGAPITWSSIVSPQNPLLQMGRDANQRGIENYKAFMERFGHDNMWLLVDESKELFVDDLPQWFGR